MLLNQLFYKAPISIIIINKNSRFLVEVVIVYFFFVKGDFLNFFMQLFICRRFVLLKNRRVKSIRVKMLTGRMILLYDDNLLSCKNFSGLKIISTKTTFGQS